MSTVTFDAPQSIGDEVIGEETEVFEEATASTDELVSTEAESNSEPIAAPAPQDEPAVAVAQPAVTPQSTVVESPERSESDDILDQIWNAEQECRRKEAHLELLKEQIKEAKASLEQSVIRLRELCSENVQPRVTSTPTRQDTTKPPAPTATVEPMGESIVGMPPAAAAEQLADNAWREVPLTELLKEPIKGLGPKKSESLVDLCPTMGAFDDLRNQASRDFKPFHELLPDRFGIDTASAVEERFLNWITAHASGTKSTGTETVSVLKRATEINTGDTNCLDFKHPEGKQWHDSGWNAYSRDVKLEECPYIPGPEQDDWIRGWLGHELMDRYDKNHQADEQAESKPEDQVSEQPTDINRQPTIMEQASSLDDL